MVFVVSIPFGALALSLSRSIDSFELSVVLGTQLHLVSLGSFSFLPFLFLFSFEPGLLFLCRFSFEPGILFLFSCEPGPLCIFLAVFGIFLLETADCLCRV